MRQTQSLAQLRDDVIHRATRLEMTAVQSVWLSDIEKRRAGSYLAIELHNLWASFARSIFLSVMCGTTTSSGLFAAPSAGPCVDDADALQKAIAFVHAARGREPHWFETQTFTRLANNFGFSNISSLAAALSYQTDLFRLAPTFRNYFAHKNHQSFEKVERIRRREFPRGARCPAKLILEPTFATRSPLMIEWINDVKVMAGLAVQ